MLSDNELIERAVKFLKSSSDYYKTSQTRMDRDMQMYSGSFWDDALIKDWYRADRPHEVWNMWKVFVNAIASPYSASPYHIELESKKDRDSEDLQDFINTFEHDSDFKNHIVEWLANAAIVGQAAATISIIDKANDQQEIKLELIDDMSTVAFDPNINTTSGEDAEEGAIVNYISLNKAKRLYGDDVVSLDYPRIVPPLCSIGTQWPTKEDVIQEVIYYYKNDAGKVMFSKMCGSKIVEHKEMPYDIIPIIRITGYKIRTTDRKKDYIGVVRSTYSLQLGANIGYSTLLERMNRNPKGNFLMPVGAIENLEKYYQMAGAKDSLLYLYNGTIAPTPIKESFETADLANTIENSMGLMSNVLGIPLTGINGLNLQDKTATEVLVQQTNSMSNVSCFYTSTYEAIRTVGRILISLKGFDPAVTVFSLQNGPDIVTRNAKKRQELSLLSSLVPENMKPVIAKYIAETLDDSMAENLAKDIVANMDPNIKLVSDTPEDPNAVHILNGMKQTLDTTMQQLQASKNENIELKKQIDMLNLQMLNMKGQQELDFRKFMIEQQNKSTIEQAKLMAQGVKIDNEAQEASDKAMLEAEKIELEKKKVTADIINDIERTGGGNAY